MTHYPHSGDLAKDSPGLLGTLGTFLPKEDVSSLEDSYRKAASLGALNEFPIKRKEGASFNPRPARLCSLLLKEGELREVNTLSASFFLPSDENKVEKIPPEEATLIKSARSLFESHPLSEHAVLLSLVWHLDLIRHLHMSSLSDQEKSELCLLTNNKLLPISSRVCSSRLHVLLEQSVSRQAKNLKLELDALIVE